MRSALLADVCQLLRVFFRADLPARLRREFGLPSLAFSGNPCLVSGTACSGLLLSRALLLVAARVRVRPGMACRAMARMEHHHDVAVGVIAETGTS